MLLTYYLSFIYMNNSRGTTFLVINYIFSAFCIFNIFNNDECKFGLNNTFYIFYYLFFGIAPVFQYCTNTNIWGGSDFTDYDYTHGMTIALLSVIIYEISNMAFQKKRCKIITRYEAVQYRALKASPILLLAISSVSFLLFFAFNDFNILNLLIRVGDKSAEGLSALILYYFIRPIPAASLMAFKSCNCKNRIIEILLWIIMLFANFPTGMARFAVAGLYIPVLFQYSNWLRKRYNFSLFLIFAVMIVFPFLNLFRLLDAEITLGLNFDMFLAGHFDSFQMFMRVMKDDVVTYGNQLLGVLFFFVPRSIWTTKPIGSGHFVATESGYYFDNVSMNYLGEGFLNFGYLGILIFVLLISYFNAYMDTRYWYGKRTRQFTIYYYIFMGMEFVILRGQLMSFYPIVLGFVCSAYLVYTISARFKLQSTSPVHRLQNYR